MTYKRKKFGQQGEDAAAAYLKKNGYRILARNFRTQAGEVDLVAEEGGAVVFVEVKSRAGAAFGQPIDALTPHKVGKLRQVAALFLARHRLEGKPARFDVVSVAGEAAHPESWRLEILKNAFQD